MNPKTNMKVTFNDTSELLELTSYNFSVAFYIKDIEFDSNDDEDLYQLLDMIDGKTSTFECKLDADEHNSLEVGLDMESEPALFRINLQNIYDICVEYEDNKEAIASLLQHVFKRQNINLVDENEDNNEDNNESKNQEDDLSTTST